MIETTLVLIKPDGVKRELLPQILPMFQLPGLTMVGIKLIPVAPREIVEEHYREHSEKPYFEKLVDKLADKPVIAIAYRGPYAVERVRLVIGPTKPEEASPQTIRGKFMSPTGNYDYEKSQGRMVDNVIHGSDSPSEGLREIDLWFDTTTELLGLEK